MKIMKQSKKPFAFRACRLVIILFPMLLVVHSPLFALTVQMEPQNLSIGIGYHGSHLSITGQHAPGEQVIIKVSSQATDSHLKYKGKAAGAVWMKMGNMTFKPVPMAYLVYSPESLTQMLSEEALIEHNLGFQALSATIEVESEKKDLDKQLWLSEFFKYKEDEQLYKVDETGLSSGSSGESDQFQYEIEWPYQAPPGSYQLEAFAVKDKQVVDQVSRDFTIERTGLVALLSKLAFEQAVLYGIIAIVVAALAGFSVGFVFKGGGGAH